MRGGAGQIFSLGRNNKEGELGVGDREPRNRPVLIEFGKKKKKKEGGGRRSERMKGGGSEKEGRGRKNGGGRSRR